MKAILASVLALGMAAVFAQDQSAITHPDFKKALEYSLKDARTGETVKLQDLAGKYKAIYIDSYASWCPDCKRALPDVVKLNEQLKDKGVLVIGLDVWDKLADMQKHMEANKLHYLLLHDPAEQDVKNGITNLLGITNIPTVVILDGKTLEQKGFFVDEKAVHVDEEREALRSLGVN